MNDVATQNISRLEPHHGAMPTTASLGMSDLQLIELSQARDHAAFTALLKRYEHRVTGALYRLAPDIRDCRDLSQEVFIRVWKSIPNLRNPLAFGSWLSQVTTNAFYDELRRRPPFTVSTDSPIIDQDGNEGCTPQCEDTSASADELAEHVELMQAITQAFSDLPPIYRNMVLLRDVEDMTYSEICSRTNVSLGTVKSRICRGRTRMKRMLSAQVSNSDNNPESKAVGTGLANGTSPSMRGH